MRPIKPKPIPPKDLWAQLDEHLAALKVQPPPPEGAFNLKMFSEKYGIGRSVAHDRMAKLLKAEKITIISRTSKGYWYKLVE